MESRRHYMASSHDLYAGQESGQELSVSVHEKEAKETAQPEYFSVLSCPQIPLESEIKPKHCLLITAICYLSPQHLCCLHGLGMNPLLSLGQGTLTLPSSPKRLDGEEGGG